MAAASAAADGPPMTVSTVMTMGGGMDGQLADDDEGLSPVPVGGSETSAIVDSERGRHGHFFSKKTFHRPTYCHHCTDMLWGLIGQGYLCEGQ